MVVAAVAFSLVVVVVVVVAAAAAAVTALSAIYSRFTPGCKCKMIDPTNSYMLQNFIQTGKNSLTTVKDQTSMTQRT